MAGASVTVGSGVAEDSTVPVGDGLYQTPEKVFRALVHSFSFPLP